FARCLIEVNSEVDLVDVVTIGIPSLTRVDFIKETIHVVSPSIVATSNVVTPTVGQFAGPSIKPNTTGCSSKNDNIITSNSYSALNEEEDEEEDNENVYDETANLFLNTKTSESSSFTAVVG
ncbi:hypothetical protein Tco_1364324, partial [Tanacetum coccineum]